MRLHAAPMPDDPGLLAVLYGPLLLAARLGRAGLDAAHLRAAPTRPRMVPGYPLPPAPLDGIFDERYVVYWRVLERAAQPVGV